MSISALTAALWQDRPLCPARSFQTGPCNICAVWPCKDCMGLPSASKSMQSPELESSSKAVLLAFSLCSIVRPHPSAPSPVTRSCSEWPSSLLWKSQFLLAWQESRAANHESQPESIVCKKKLTIAKYAVCKYVCQSQVLDKAVINDKVWDICQAVLIHVAEKKKSEMQTLIMTQTHLACISGSCHRETFSNSSVKVLRWNDADSCSNTETETTSCILEMNTVSFYQF